MDFVLTGIPVALALTGLVHRGYRLKQWRDRRRPSVYEKRGVIGL